MNFIDYLCTKANVIFVNKEAPKAVQAIAYSIFQLYQKKVPFSEFDHILLATLSVYLAIKIENMHIRYDSFQRFYFEHKGKTNLYNHEVIAKMAQEPLPDIDLSKPMTAAQKLKAKKALKKRQEAMSEPS